MAETIVTLVCNHCGKTFERRAAHAYRKNRPPSKHCSPGCVHAARAEPSHRFWPQVKKAQDGCWEWQGGLTVTGYGKFSWGGKSIHAHRASYMLIYGDIPDDLWVLHRCDNRPCVRPDHLFLGTPQDNSQDREQKGRGNAPIGERAHSAVLTADQVREIRALRREGLGVTVLAQRFKVGRMAIHKIVSYQRWKHID